MSRALQQTLAEEKKKRGLKQADIARTLGVDRATITRQIRGEQNMTLFRAGELAFAMGRIPVISFVEPVPKAGSNIAPMVQVSTTTTQEAANFRSDDIRVGAANG